VEKNLVDCDILTVLNWSGIRFWARLRKGSEGEERLLPFLRWFEKCTLFNL
jgi:hypothetical protein